MPKYLFSCIKGVNLLLQDLYIKFILEIEKFSCEKLSVIIIIMVCK
jgi:hypothetical protein